MKRQNIKANPGSGWNFVFRAGRGWPTGGTIVDVVEDQDDPPAEKTPHGEPLRIGQASLRKLIDDPRIRVLGEGEDVNELEVLRARIAELEATAEATRTAEAARIAEQSKKNDKGK